MTRLAELLASIVVIVSWFAGIALASGFWSTTITIIFPPYAWYLVVEKILLTIGWLG